MHLSQINNTSFGARIISSKALDSALELAQSEANSGTKEGMKLAADFYNNLRTIEKDVNVDYFFVDANPTHLPPYMRLGNSTRLLEFMGRSTKDLARSIIDGVNKLVKAKYLKSEIADEAKNSDLSKAFLRWV